jgi:hypothetical protein
VSRNILLKKGVPVALILLFFGVAVVPSISIIGAKVDTTEHDLVEVTTEVYGIKGFGNHTVKLTRQQNQNLERYIVGFRERLNQTTTREETVVLLKEAVVELNKYGLLPKGMSVEHAQRLVTGNYQKSNSLNKIQNRYQSNAKIKQKQNLNPNMKNAFCLLFATATKIPGYLPSPFIIPLGLLIVLGIGPSLLFSLIGAENLAKQLADLGLLIWMLNPLRFINFVLFAGYDIDLRSIGLKGLVNENFGGDGLFIGYTGLMIYPLSDKTYFLGFALSVNSLS